MIAADLSPVLLGALGSLAAGLATAVGAAPILFIDPPSERRERVLLGFSAGVMLAASFFSLIMPGVEVLEAGGNPSSRAAAVMAMAVLLGAGGIAAMNRFAPVDHLVIGESGDPRGMIRRIWLFVIAITLHNFPEGMAVGVSFGTGDLDQGLATALGIGIQNMPEGLAVAASLATLGYGRGWSFLGALATGLVEPLGGLLGVLVVVNVGWLLPWGLGLAGGAMIYVVTAEIIPLSQREDADGHAILALMVGLVGMMFLDIALG
ncbi:ZIP family metal transporter [Stella sp.]|uniref:ZIP family metal transporter n=1 Tax=Stella sp. TaxID=2912054 RepID=UPI0035B02D2F